MANFTKKVDLRKPLPTEKFDIDRDFNENWDKIDEELGNFDQRIDDIAVTVAEGASEQEISDARHGESTLGQNLLKMKEGIHLNTYTHPSLNAIWQAPSLPDTLRGNGKVPSGYDPDEHLDALMDILIDGEYVTKTTIGLDQSEQYTLRRYDFTPEHYEKTIVLSGCLHGNEYSGFYSLTQFLELLVNNWGDYPQLAYLRKNVRIVVLPIINMWGFANQKRQNSRQVDLNRNTDYAWEQFSHNQEGMIYYKGVAPFSERETKNVKDVFESLDNVVAFIDTHSIQTIGNVEYCVFYPRFTEQNNEPFIQALWEMHEESEKLVFGSSSLPSLTNYVSENYGATSLLSEVVNGISGATRSGAEMTRMVTFFGNLIIKAGLLRHEGKVENLTEPFTKYYAYDRSQGNIFGTDGGYEGADGEEIPINNVNHATSTLKTYSTNYAYTGLSSMKMSADNQVINARADFPDMLNGRHYLWMMRKRVDAISLGEFRLSVYSFGGFSNRTDLSVTEVPDTDWQLVGGILRGRNEGVRLLYGSSTSWTGDVYVDNNMLIEITREEYDDFEAGVLTLEDMAQRYDFEYQSDPPVISVPEKSNYATLSHFEDRMDIKTQGIYLMDGFVTFTISEPAEVGFILQTYQPYSPETKWSDTKDNTLLGTRRRFEAGTHTVPVMSQLFAEVTNITAVGWKKRTGQAVIRLRGYLSNGSCVVDSVRYRATFFPSMSGKRYTGLNSTGRELMPKEERYEIIFPVVSDMDEED